jgi:AP-3 complex subunit sigma
MSEEEQQAVIRKIFKQVSSRPETFCNYLEGCVPEFGDSTKIIYRNYASLFIIFAVDQQESDLGILDLIQVFVESLDICFETVCELDLIFHSDKVHYIIDEIISAGMVLETNLTLIMQAINDQKKLAVENTRTSGPMGSGPAHSYSHSSHSGRSGDSYNNPYSSGGGGIGGGGGGSGGPPAGSTDYVKTGLDAANKIFATLSGTAAGYK